MKRFLVGSTESAVVVESPKGSRKYHKEVRVPGRVYMVNEDGSKTVFADELGLVQGIATDGQGNIYVSILSPTEVSPLGQLRRTRANGRVLVFSEDGSPIKEITGLDNPTGLACDEDGNLYISIFGSGNIGQGSIMVYDGTNVETIDHALTAPSGLAFDSNGLLVTDYGAATNVDVVRVIEDAPNQNAMVSNLVTAPFGIDVTDDVIYVAGANGKIITQAPASAARVWKSDPLLNNAMDIEDAGDNVYVTTFDGNLVRILRNPLGAAMGVETVATGLGFATGLCILR